MVSGFVKPGHTLVIPTFLYYIQEEYGRDRDSEDLYLVCVDDKKASLYCPPVFTFQWDFVDFAEDSSH